MPEENKRLYGYARVSSRGQCLDRQLDALKARGIPERDIYIDKASGKDFERPEYQRMKQQLQAGDTLVVLDLDRLGRNYNELAVEWNLLTLVTGIEIEVLNLPVLNTAQDCRSLGGKFVANLVFNVLNYVAEQEREDIRQRQREGIESARKNGVKFGRPKVERPDEFASVYDRVLRHEITNRQAMELLGLKPNTYYKFTNEEKERMQLC